MSKPTVVSRQLISAVHHAKSRFDRDWFGRGQCVLVVEKARLSDGSTRKNLIKFQDPTVRYRVTAEAFRAKQTIPTLFVPIAETDEFDSPVMDVDRHAAELTGQMDYYNETRGPGQGQRRRKLHDHRWLHGTDVNVADHYIDRYMEWVPTTGAKLDTTSPLECAFADIEVDGIDVPGFPNEFDAPAPINLISYFHRPSRKLTQFLTRTMVRDNPQIAEFEGKLDEMSEMILCEVNRAPLEKAGLIQPEDSWEEIQNVILAHPEGQANMRCTDVDLRFFDTEKELLLAFLHHINEVDKPDVLAWWNMCFDVNTIINRLRRLDVNPEEAFTPEAFSDWPLAQYDQDRFNTEATERKDMFTAACWTIWVDQMLLYASLRKQSGKKESYGLDFTLNAELKEHKLAYEGSIRDFAYRDYTRFVLYGALDTVPMATLEDKTEDIALAYQISMMTRTRFHKVMVKTVCLRNFASVFYRERGFALSNNRNRNKERVDSVQFRGGLVADPTLMEAVGTEVGGTPSDRVYDDVVDFDATSLYPSLILAFNIDASGQVGRLVIPTDEGDMDADKLIEAYASGDPVEVGKRWMGMPGLAELAELVLDKEVA
jgi:hypothetical protein